MNKRNALWTLCLLILAILGPSGTRSAHATVVLYAADARQDVLLTIESDDASSSVVGPLNVNRMANIAWVNDRLLGFESSIGLHEIDVATGDTTQLGSIPAGFNGGGALAFDPTTDNLYATLSAGSGQGQNRLVTLDPNTGELVETIGTLPFDGDGMAIHPVTGQMYVLDIVGTDPLETLLWKVNKLDATAVNLGVTGLDRPQGMAFHPITHDLYIAEGGLVDPAPQNLYIMDPMDLSTQVIGELDFLGIGGMAFTPEPSTIVILGLGCWITLAARRNRVTV